jgi:excisionase family DNA binding protein
MDEPVRRPYTAEEVAALLGINVKTVYEAIKAGQIPSIRVGARILIPRMAFDRMLDGDKAATGPIAVGA